MSSTGNIPSSICWCLRRLEDMSWRLLQQNNFLSSKTSWRHLAIRLEDVLEEEKLLRWRRLQDGLKICLEDVLKTCHEASWRHILKMFLRHVLKTSSRRLGDKQNIYWGYLYLTNLNVYHFTNLYLTNLRQIQNALFRTQQFRYSSYFEIQAAFLF